MRICKLFVYAMLPAKPFVHRERDATLKMRIIIVTIINITHLLANHKTKDCRFEMTLMGGTGIARFDARTSILEQGC